MSEIKVSFQACAEAIPLKYVVIVLRDGDQVLWTRHRRRSSWEIPGGHLEPGETPRQAAERELWEETGVTQAELEPVCIYTVSQDGRQDSGLLYAASAGVQGPLPAFEMAETRWFSELPEELTYPEIQPLLWRQARQVRGQGTDDELSQMTDIFNE